MKAGDKRVCQICGKEFEIIDGVGLENIVMNVLQKLIKRENKQSMHLILPQNVEL